MLGQLAQIVRSDPATLALNRKRQLMKHLERVGPVALALVDAHQVIQGHLPILARGRQLLEQPLGAIHQSGAEIVQRKSEGRLVAQPGAAVVSQAGMNRDRAVDLAAAPEETAEGKLDLRYF